MRLSPVLFSIASALLLSSAVGCPLTFTECTSDADCLGDAFCDLAQSRCTVETVAPDDGGDVVRPDAGPDAGAPEPEGDAGDLDAGDLDAGAPEPEVDAGDLDAGDLDAGVFDAGDIDAGVFDAGDLDAGVFDAGVFDAGVFDAGDLDAGVFDAGDLDAGDIDAGVFDAGDIDAGVFDAGPCLDLDGDLRGTGCALGPDCNELTAAQHTTMLVFIDVDGDDFTIGTQQTLCTDGNLPSGFALQQSGTADCNDNSAAIFLLRDLFVDFDGDTVTVGQSTPQCTSEVVPVGFAANQSPLDDCDDDDDEVGSGPDTDNDGTPNCLDDDDDGDGLTDDAERIGTPIGFPSNALIADTDGDGVDDGLDAAPTIAACTTSVLFADTFNTLDPAWFANFGGIWDQDADTATMQSTTLTEGAAVWIGPNDNWTNYVMQTRVTPRSSFGDVGVLFRAQNISSSNDGGQQYYFGLQPQTNNVFLSRMNDGFTDLQNVVYPTDPDVEYTVRVELNGNSIAIFVNDTQVIDDTDTSYSTGSIGFRTFQNRADYHDVIVCQ